MGAIFTLLTIRGAILLMTIASASVGILVAISGNQPTFDPFEPYADILLVQSSDALSQWGFDCQFNFVYSLNESCLLIPETGLFSEIQVTFAPNPDSIKLRSIAFIPHEKALTLGQLALIWGKPQMAVYAQTVNFRWPNAHVTAIPQPYPSNLSYWLPITYVIFKSAD